MAALSDLGGVPLGAVQSQAERARPSLEDIYRSHGPNVARWVQNLGGPRVEVADLVQEVFVSVQERLPSFEGRLSLTTWLYRLTANVVSNHRRLRRPWFTRARAGAEEVDGLQALGAGAEAALEQEERRRMVYAILDRLKERHRTVLVLFEIEERSGDEIAELLGLKVNAVWALVHRARAAFLKELRRGETQEVA